MAVVEVNGALSDAYLDFNKFGRYHYMQFMWVCLPIMFVAMLHVNYIFVAEIVDIRCIVPECEEANPSVALPVWWPEEVDARCFRPALDIQEYNKSNQTCSNNTFIGRVEECRKWIYANNNSIVSELNLGCESWKATLVGGVHNAGMVMSMIITGLLADKFGRKPILILCSIGSLVGVVKVFLKNYYVYLGIEFLESFLASGIYTVGVVLLIEIGGESKRVMTGVIFSYAVYAGEMVFAFIAMALKHWKMLILGAYSPMVLFVAYKFVIKESTRWQLLRGRTDEAKDTLQTIARLNKIKLTPKEIADISDKDLTRKLNVVSQTETESFKNIITSREMMLRLVVTSFSFFTSSFVYYSMVVHSVLLPGDKYVNFMLSSIASFPGDLLALYTCNKYGRRITQQCGYIVSATLLIAQTYTSNSISWLKILLFLCGKISIVVCFASIYTHSLEMFPTSVRGTMFGIGCTAARVGGMLAPLTPLLAKELDALPSILFSSTGVIAALLLMFTPETKYLPMFDTIEQIEKYNSKIVTHF